MDGLTCPLEPVPLDRSSWPPEAGMSRGIDLAAGASTSGGLNLAAGAVRLDELT